MNAVKIISLFLIIAFISGCENMSKEQWGALGGAAAGAGGGYAASALSHGKISKTTGTAIGTAVGAAAGYGVGKYLNDRDKKRVTAASADTARSGQARMLRTEDGATVKTSAVDAPHTVPVQADSQPTGVQTASTARQCRTIHQAIVLKDGSKDEEDVTACKSANGAWEVQNG